MEAPTGAVEECSIRSHGRTFSVRVPSSDIDGCIRVTFLRGVFTVLALVLAVTDIPRTGLTISFTDYHSASVAPDTVTYWGPYEYLIAHLNTTTAQSAVGAYNSADRLDALDLWPYKFDTLSIAQRAVAQHLNVASYPDCVLYRKDCETEFLKPATVFRMLDDLVSAIQVSWFPIAERETTSFVFSAKSNWVDRLNHYMYRFLTKNPENRLHTVYHYGHEQPFRICSRDPEFRSFDQASQPMICDHPIVWMCDHPVKRSGERRHPIWDHIMIRVQELQRQYPDVNLDLTVLASNFLEQTHRGRRVLPTAFFAIDTIEMTTLIRGRRCHDAVNASQCETVFIDDYRYERSVVQSDEAQWRNYLWALRSLSQLYVWIRVGLLLWGCYRARTAESCHQSDSLHNNVLAIVCTILKIPGHTIVYGSWPPILGFALAHFFDSSVVHFVSEFQWSSLQGLFAFDPVGYVIQASIQMRNIWMIAIIWKISLTVASAVTLGRSIRTNAKEQGKLAIRGGWIGLVSWLTTFGLMRTLHFRDCNVVSITELQRHMPVYAAQSQNYADKGARLDLKCALAACVVIFVGGWSIKLFVGVLTGQTTSPFMCRSFYVPHSAGTIWSRSVLDTQWGFNCVPPSNSKVRIMFGPSIRRLANLSVRQISFKPGGQAGECRLCGFPMSPIHWRPAQGCTVHEPIFDVHRRTKEVWSMVRLANIANMTDPLVFFRLRVLGTRLFVYSVRCRDQPRYYLLLPTAPHDMEQSGRGLSIEMESVVDSRDIPWHVLVNCG